MPDRRRHRGPHPQDAESFAAPEVARLRAAAGDLVWLLDRGYAEVSALKLVGDRHGLRQRQRTAVLRVVCPEAARHDRQAREVAPAALEGGRLAIDGYNALITVEAALAGGVLLLARDGCLRDMASLHGSFRRVAETVPALELLGRSLAGWGAAEAEWLLDAPVSNSGRLAALMRGLARRHSWPWTVRVESDPDGLLAASEAVVATADSAVFDRCGRWFNLARRVVEAHVPDASALDFR